MHTVDLSKYSLRTDLVIEKINSELKCNHYEQDGVIVDDISLEKGNPLNKKAGRYITISFDDVTDQVNYQKVLEKGKTVSLFDMQKFTKSFEKACQEMYLETVNHL